MSESRWTMAYESGHRDTPWVVVFMGNHIEARFRVEPDALEYIARKVAISKGDSNLQVVQ